MSGQTFAHLVPGRHRWLGGSGGTALLEEVHPGGRQALRVYSPTPLPRILLWPLAALPRLSSRNNSCLPGLLLVMVFSQSNQTQLSKLSDRNKQTTKRLQGGKGHLGTMIPKGLIPSGEEGVAKSTTTEAYGGSASHDRGSENRKMLKPRQACLQRPSPKGLLQQLDPASYRFPQAPKHCHQMGTTCSKYEFMGYESDQTGVLRGAGSIRQKEGNALGTPKEAVSNITWGVGQLC